MKALTLINLVCFPLAFTVSFFSMMTLYGPGDERFWLYFDVSVPLMLAVLGTYFLLHVSYRRWQRPSIRDLRVRVRWRSSDQ